MAQGLKNLQESATYKKTGQVLLAKERHAAGLKRRLGITAWREFSEDMAQGLKNLQESATYKKTAENIQLATDLAKEKTTGLISTIGRSEAWNSVSSSISSAYDAAKTKMSNS